MKYLRNKLELIKAFFILRVRRSNILLINGKRYELQQQYKHLCSRKDIHITSVNVSKNFTEYGRTEDLIMSISYDYYA